MEYLRVRDWEQFQHYNKRTPPWIKLHRDLLNNYKFSCLQDASKTHLVLIWLLASQMDNKIPADPQWIQQRISTETPPDINLLIDKGYLAMVQDDSNVLATRKQSATPETETETETETYKTPTSAPKAPTCPHQEIISLYHEVLPERPCILIDRWKGSASEGQLKARWRENDKHQDLDWWRGYFQAVKTNDWWMGRDRWKGVDLHWLVKRNNFDKVVQHWANAA